MSTATADVTPSRLPPHSGRPFASDDLAAMPDDGRRYEVVDGVLLVSPAPLPLHQRVVLRVAMALTAHCPDELEVFVAPLDVRLAEDTTVQPDVLVLPRVADPHRLVTVVPTLVVEVRSPSTGLSDATLKRAVYERHGVRHCWLVDPDAPSLEVLTLGPDGRYDEGVTTHGSDTFETVEPFRVTIRPADLVRR